MTENKRFTYDSKTVSILKDGEFWLDGNVDTACNHKEICGLLNELNDENEQLRFDFKQMKELLHSLEDEIKKLEKENNELKYHLNETEKELKEYKDFMGLG